MISTFGSRVHAKNWARRWAEKHPHESYCICKIEVSPSYRVFSAAELVSVLDIPVHPGMKTEMLRDEYLIFRNVYDSDIEF